MEATQARNTTIRSGQSPNPKRGRNGDSAVAEDVALIPSLLLEFKGGHSLTEEEKDDVVESQKLSKRDKQEIQEGACVNCAVATFVLMFLMLVSLVL
jgi:hypothetical protein